MSPSSNEVAIPPGFSQPPQPPSSDFYTVLVLVAVILPRFNLVLVNTKSLILLLIKLFKHKR